MSQVSHRPPRIILSVVLAGMIAGSVALYLRAAGDPPITGMDWLSILWCPLGLAMLWALFEWGAYKRERLKDVTILPMHQRYNRMALGLLMFTSVLSHGAIIAFAFDVLGHDARENMARYLLIGLAIVIIVIGNGRGRLVTPYRNGAKEPFDWQKHQRTVGWGMVMVGLVMIPCALLLPLEPVAYAMFGACAAVLIVRIAIRMTSRKATGA